MKRISPSDYNFDKVHIIGNGPSADLFNESEGLVISIHSPKVNSDMVFSQRHHHWGYYGIPPIYRLSLTTKSTYAVEIFKDSTLRSSICKYCAILDWTIITLHPLMLGNANSGHLCYLWVQHHKPKEVHLWGFDSLWQDEYNYKDSYVAEHEFKKKSKVGESHFTEERVRLEYKEFWKEILQDNTEIHK